MTSWLFTWPLLALNGGIISFFMTSAWLSYRGAFAWHYKGLKWPFLWHDFLTWHGRNDLVFMTPAWSSMGWLLHDSFMTRRDCSDFSQSCIHTWSQSCTQAWFLCVMCSSWHFQKMVTVPIQLRLQFPKRLDLDCSTFMMRKFYKQSGLLLIEHLKNVELIN